MMLSRCSVCNNKKSTFTAEPSFQNVLHKDLVYNTNRDRMKDALWNAFNQ